MHRQHQLGRAARTEPALLPLVVLDCCTARNRELLPRPEARQYMRGVVHIIAPGCFVQRSLDAPRGRWLQSSGAITQCWEDGSQPGAQRCLPSALLWLRQHILPCSQITQSRPPLSHQLPKKNHSHFRYFFVLKAANKQTHRDLH